MVEEVPKAEKRAIEHYSKRATEAEEFGDKGLTVKLGDMVSDENTYAEETKRTLID